MATIQLQDGDQIKSQVRERYGSIATAYQAGRQTSCCGSDGAADTTAALLYQAEELGQVPGDIAGMSLGCGNPIALAELQPGEVVLDLGSGAGLDCFLAAQRVGPAGRVIGLDMTLEMLKLARRNAAKIGATNVEFRQGEMEHMPVEDASVDIVISNCVINLSPDKDRVFAEAYRVLKPGGRLAISDIVTQGELPEAIRRSIEAWTGCVAGALAEETYLAKIRRAGFTDVQVVGRTSFSQADIQLLPEEALETLTRGVDPELVQVLPARVASIKVAARKPNVN